MQKTGQTWNGGDVTVMRMCNISKTEKYTKTTLKSPQE